MCPKETTLGLNVYLSDLNNSHWSDPWQQQEIHINLGNDCDLLGSEWNAMFRYCFSNHFPNVNISALTRLSWPPFTNGVVITNPCVVFIGVSAFKLRFVWELLLRVNIWHSFHFPSITNPSSWKVNLLLVDIKSTRFKGVKTNKLKSTCHPREEKWLYNYLFCTNTGPFVLVRPILITKIKAHPLLLMEKKDIRIFIASHSHNPHMHSAASKPESGGWRRRRRRRWQEDEGRGMPKWSHVGVCNHNYCCSLKLYLGNSVF